MRFTPALALCLTAGCRDVVFCPDSVDRVERVWIHSPTESTVYLWQGDTTFIGASAGRDRSEVCPEDEEMFTSLNHSTKFNWSSTDSAVATALPVGSFVGPGPGVASISVKVGSRTAEPRPVRVGPRLTELRVTATPLEPRIGDTVRVTVHAIGVNGEVVSGPLIEPLHADYHNHRWVKGTVEATENSFVAATPGAVNIRTRARRTGPSTLVGEALIMIKP